jgi:predicted phosphoribosyltransferase
VFFENRAEAGKLLAARLCEVARIKQADQDELLVLSIPRGGVVVGIAVAQALGCAHDVVVVKKIGFPGHEEMAIGAVAEDGLVLLDKQTAGWYPVEDDYMTKEIAEVKARVTAYIRKFRDGANLDVTSKIVIVVDDGVATGETMKAAVKWLKSIDDMRKPKEVIVAVPVCAPNAAIELEQMADEFICLAVPEYFWAVGQFYREFVQVSDREVLSLLRST